MRPRLAVVSACWTLLFIGLPTAAVAGDEIEIRLWPGVAPGSEGVLGSEKVELRSTPDGAVDRSIRNVHIPQMYVHRPKPDNTNGTAIVICPGGGYGRVVIDKEGHDIARWLTQLGITACVLKYRNPTTESHFYGAQAPHDDVQRAIRTVRHHAKHWQVLPDRVGVMGFSAGGHLASMAATLFDDGQPDADNPIARHSSRPDFAVLVYPGISMKNGLAHAGSRNSLLGEKPTDDEIERYSTDQQVTEQTPPTFLVHASDDFVTSENSARFYLALKQKNVPAELHIFATGGHGYGIRKQGKPVNQWPTLCEQWLATNGWINPQPATSTP